MTKTTQQQVPPGGGVPAVTPTTLTGVREYLTSLGIPSVETPKGVLVVRTGIGRFGRKQIEHRLLIKQAGEGLKADYQSISAGLGLENADPLQAIQEFHEEGQAFCSPEFNLPHRLAKA